MARRYMADTHYGHEGMLTRMDKRNFDTITEMDEYMIKQHNSVVRKNDEVVYMGDLSIYSAEKVNEILDRLNGKLYLITGNHDKFLKDKKFNRDRFEWIKDYAELRDNGRKVILSHYPIFCYNGQFRRDENGVPTTWMLHGHTHLTPDQILVEKFKEITRNYPRISRGNDVPTPAPMQMINTFCMLSDYVPLTLDEWIELENSGKILEMLQKDWRYDG